jgi:putative membrane protein
MYEHGVGGSLMWLFWIFWMVVIVWAVKMAMRDDNQFNGKERSALDILNERYAKGEIDEEEFAKSKRLLSDSEFQQGRQHGYTQYRDK